MKLSKRGEYALRALIDLGIAEHFGKPMLSIGALARSEKIPATFLEQILIDLRNAGFVDSRRGKAGGYFLARPAGAIVIGEVVRHVDGTIAPISCVSRIAYERCTCPDEDHCGLRMLMMDVRTSIVSVLDRHTLKDVVDVTMKQLRRDRQTPAFVAHGRSRP